MLAGRAVNSLPARRHRWMEVVPVVRFVAVTNFVQLLVHQPSFDPVSRLHPGTKISPVLELGRRTNCAPV